MPEGIVTTVDNGFATIDFVDISQRGPGLAKLVDIGGPETVETITRRGARRQYRVPEGNAREAGLLDDDDADGEQARGSLPGGAPSNADITGGTGTTTATVTSAGNDSGAAAALKAADPNVNAGGDAADWHTPTAEYTSANKYVGQVPNANVLHNRHQVHTGDAGGVGIDVEHPPTHREVIDYVKEASQAAAAGGARAAVEKQNLIPVSHINTALKGQTAALGTDPGARPDAGGEAIDSQATSVQSTRVDGGPQDGQTSATIEGTSDAAPADPETPTGTSVTGVADVEPAPGEPITPADPEDVVEYPQGEPSDKWRRDELDAYALKVKGLETTGLESKKAVLSAINPPKE